LKYVLILLGKTKTFNFHMLQLKDNDAKRQMWKGFNMELLKFHPKGQPLMEPKTYPLNQLQCTILTIIKNCYVEFFEIFFLMCLKFRKIYTIIFLVVLKNIYIFSVMVEFSCWCPQEHWNPFFLISLIQFFF
jgi:hypothetical protein